MGERAVPPDQGEEELLLALAGFLEVLLVHHHTHGELAVLQGDVPGPGLVEADEVEEREPPVALRWLLHAPEPRVDAELIEVRVLLLHPKLAGQLAAAAGGVHHIPSTEVALPPVGHLSTDPHSPIPFEQDVGHLDALKHLHSVFMGVAEQHRVHLVALDVVRVGLGRSRERELEQPDLHELPQGGPGGVPTRPRLVDEAVVVHLVQETDPVEHQVRRWCKRLPHVVPGVDVLLQDDGLVAVLSQERAERGTGRTSTNDDHIRVQGTLRSEIECDTIKLG